MSWLFSQALVAAYSAATCSDGVPSAQLNVMPTQHPFWRNDRTMDACRFSRFGLTCEVLTAGRGEALLTWFRAGFRARTLAQPVEAQASTVRDPAFGEKWHESSVRYDLNSCSWKTHQCLWDEDLPWFSVTLPKWGLMLSGFVFQRETSVRPISGIVFGLWPTPVASEATVGPRKPDGKRGARLTGIVGNPSMWPTPVASMAKGSSPGALTRKSGADRSNDRLDHAVMASDGGQLNPTGVEWLMGWPIGWTDLKPLAMDKFREWQQQHGG